MTEHHRRESRPEQPVARTPLGRLFIAAGVLSGIGVAFVLVVASGVALFAA